MPVLVTGADRLLARRCVLRLLEEGGEVRAYGSGDLSMLRAAGAMVAVGTEDDEARLEAALTDVHTVVHVGAGLLTSQLAAADHAVDTLLTAAENAGVARIIGLSLPGAAPNANDPLRQHKGRMETAMADASMPTIMLRTSLIDTAAVRDALLTSVPVELHDTPVAPVTVDDLIELVVAFDAARSRAQTGHLVVAVDGPDQVAIFDYLAATAGSGATDFSSRVGRKVASAASAASLTAALAGAWWSQDSTLIDGWSFAGISPRSVVSRDRDMTGASESSKAGETVRGRSGS